MIDVRRLMSQDQYSVLMVKKKKKGISSDFFLFKLDLE